MSRVDHYAVLGLTPGVGVAEIRRAFRLLALRHHPDRAGQEATATFQRIAEAYRVLSDATLRSIYDGERIAPGVGAGPSPPRAAASAPSGSSSSASAFPGGGQTAPARDGPMLIPRLCGTLATLEARRAARAHPSGAIDLHVTAEEARVGGVAAIQVPLTVPCPTCGGIAGPNGVWCRRCQFAGSIVEEVTVCVAIPAHARDGLAFNVELERLGDLPPMTVRVRID